MQKLKATIAAVVLVGACGQGQTTPSAPTKNTPKPNADRDRIPLATVAKPKCASPMPEANLCKCLGRLQEPSEDDKVSCSVSNHKSGLKVATTSLYETVSGLQGKSHYLVYPGARGHLVIAELSSFPPSRRVFGEAERVITVSTFAKRRVFHVVETAKVTDSSNSYSGWSETTSETIDTYCVEHAGAAACALGLTTKVHWKAVATKDAPATAQAAFKKQHGHTLPYETAWALGVNLSNDGVLRVTVVDGKPPKDSKIGTWRLW